MAVKNNEQGRTMIEMILYISILIVMGAVLAQTAARIFKRYNVGRTSQQLIDIKKTILMFTAADEDYTKLSNQALQDANAVPLDMANMQHALGGRIIVGPATKFPDDTNNVSPNNKYMFFVTFDHIDRASCIELLSQGQFFTTGSEMDTLNVNNNWWQYKYSLFMTGNFKPASQRLYQQRLNVNTALDACDKKTDNVITWIFS